MIDENSQNVKEPLIFEVIKNPEYKTVYASGVFGGIDPNDARLIFFVDRPDPKMDENEIGRMKTDKIFRELVIEVHMSPTQFRSLSNFMADRLKMLDEKIKEASSEELALEFEEKTE